jgi:hypothetical protein
MPQTEPARKRSKGLKSITVCTMAGDNITIHVLLQTSLSEVKELVAHELGRVLGGAEVFDGRRHATAERLSDNCLLSDLVGRNDLDQVGSAERPLYALEKPCEWHASQLTGS